MTKSCQASKSSGESGRSPQEPARDRTGSWSPPPLPPGNRCTEQAESITTAPPYLCNSRKCPQASPCVLCTCQAGRGPNRSNDRGPRPACRSVGENPRLQMHLLEARPHRVMAVMQKVRDPQRWGSHSPWGSPDGLWCNWAVTKHP